MNEILIILTVLAAVGLFLFVMFLVSLKSVMYVCAPNEVLIFSGKRRREAGREYGYRLIKGGRGYRIPLMETVDRMDLTNMVIDVSVTNAYSKGGIPLTVQGVANVKIAGHEPVLNNAIERFLGKPRIEVVEIAKATLEGSLRGILATMTPEQVNEDQIVFAERLVQEVEGDMTDLGLVVDTMKIQNVQDEVKYLDSIGRRKNAEMISRARIAEAKAKAESLVREAENFEREVRAQLAAQTGIAKADAQKRLTDATTRRDALVAEEKAQVAALLAQATAEVDVQKARVEQIRRKLEADVIQPAKAACEAAEAAAKAGVANIAEEGKARSEALTTLAESWAKAGPNAKEIFLVQKLEPIVRQIAGTIAETRIEKVTMVDQGLQGGSGPARWIAPLEQIKQLYGVDLIEAARRLGASAPEPGTPSEGSPPEA